MSNTEYGPRPQRISCQYRYIKTLPGILKVIEFVCDAAALIIGLIAPGGDLIGHKGYFTFVAALAIIITTILFIFAMINLQNVCLRDHWLTIEMFWCAFIALLYLIAGIVAATIAKHHPIYGAAAFFAFAAFIAYLVDALNRFRLSHTGPRGRHTETHTSTTTTVTQQQQPT